MVTWLADCIYQRESLDSLGTPYTWCDIYGIHCKGDLCTRDGAK